jgi:hypothetical protein
VGAILLVLSGTASSATPQRPAVDRVCAAVRQEYKRYAAVPSLPHWTWTIPHECVFVRDLAPTADCQATDVRNGCAPAPDVHVRYRGRAYVFHLTLKGVPTKAKGLWIAGATRRFIVAHDGLPPRTTQRLFVEFSGTEFDGVLQSGPNKGLPDLGPELRWRIDYNISPKHGLCCPRSDPGAGRRSPFDIVPERLTVAKE